MWEGNPTSIPTEATSQAGKALGGADGVCPHLAHMEAVIGREGDAPAGAVEGWPASTGSLEDAIGHALDAERVDVLQPHQCPGSPVQILSSGQLLLHLLEAGMEC